jgi:type III restriction enzyme
MKLKLEELAYQRKAIDAVVNIFEGQPRNTFENALFFGIRSNVISLTPEQIAANKQRIIAENNVSAEVARLDDSIDYCIEMETGTGKTLVYIRTIYELFKQYGLTKFIIVVPSIAIRQGVVQTFATFRQQLQNIYGFKLKSFEYNSKRLNNLSHFVSSATPQVMVMTLQSFARDDTIINQENREKSVLGISFLEAIAKTQPVIIMDEPQEGMDTENSIARIARFNPIAKLRYSATHKVVKNLLYRLTPYDAYQKGMVKKIEVLTVAEKNDEAVWKLEVSRIQTQKGRNPRVKFKAWVAQGGGFKWKETAWLGNGADLAEKTKNDSYLGYRIERIYKGIRARYFKVKLSNGVELVEKERSLDIEGIFRQQLYWLIDSHFVKKAALKEQGIKCLSLIFIDRVSNYVGENGLIRRLFEEEYGKAYEARLGAVATAEQLTAVQGYYFAKTGKGAYTDSESSMRKNRTIFKRILEEKEKLLSFDDPIEFIFSHSALGVGWDNPNVFNIATLNHSYSDVKKRQEIGRGLRICVNQDGQRVYDGDETPEGEEVNLLTVVPNETYASFATQYQSELREIYGLGAQMPDLRRNHKGDKEKTVVTRNEELFNGRSFREFWQKLAQKTDYVVSFDEETLISRSIAALNQIEVAAYAAEISLTRIKAMYEEAFEDEELGRETRELKATHSPLDLIEALSEATGLSYPTTLNIVQKLDNLDHICTNPAQFVQTASALIKRIELDEMMRGLSYEPTGESIPFDEFVQTIETFKETRNSPKRGIYDKVIVDSHSNPEINFAIGAESDPEVICFLKLPKFYKIPTPIGNYQPDFGIVVRRRHGIRKQNESDYYFVIETKGTNDINDTHALREDERYKIRCAQKHFERLGIDAHLEYTVYHAPVQDYTHDFKRHLP